jgi:hypothetical protein
LISSNLTVRRALAVAGVGALLSPIVPAVGADPVDVSPLGCLGPAHDAEPGTTEWTLRDRENLYCATERLGDAAQHPGGGFLVDPEPIDPRSAIPHDAYTVPERHDGQRYRYEAVTMINRDFLPVAVEFYRPCAAGTCENMPATLPTYEPPYPVVILVPGGALPGDLAPGAPKEQYRWVAQGLAEAGYMTALHDVESAHLEDAQDVLTWILSGANPVRSDVDRDHIGIAGHSGGGATAILLGFIDDRFDAIASFDGSGRYPMPADDADITKPALFFVGEYGNVPDTTYDEPPDPDGTGKRVVERFLRLKGLGVDTMHLALRAASHSDWSPHLGNRYAALVTLYYTIAWFDRYLKGADDPVIAAEAFGRLTASVFDDSADIRYISQGFFDPIQQSMSADPYGGNVPYTIAGTAVADRLSFYFRSRCFISEPGGTGRATTDDMRSDRCSL